VTASEGYWTHFCGLAVIQLELALATAHTADLGWQPHRLGAAAHRQTGRARELETAGACRSDVKVRAQGQVHIMNRSISA